MALRLTLSKARVVEIVDSSGKDSANDKGKRDKDSNGGGKGDEDSNGGGKGDEDSNGKGKRDGNGKVDDNRERLRRLER